MRRKCYDVHNSNLESRFLLAVPLSLLKINIKYLRTMHPCFPIPVLRIRGILLRIRIRTTELRILILLFSSVAFKKPTMCVLIICRYWNAFTSVFEDTVIVIRKSRNCIFCLLMEGFGAVRIRIWEAPNLTDPEHCPTPYKVREKI